MLPRRSECVLSDSWSSQSNRLLECSPVSRRDEGISGTSIQLLSPSPDLRRRSLLDRLKVRTHLKLILSLAHLKGTRVETSSVW